VIRAVPELNSPATRGQACFKGKFGLEFVNQRGRVRQPLVRREGILEESSWEEALDYIASRLADHKGDAFALLTSPDGTNEEHYLAQKFARVVMNTNNVDQTSNLQPELTVALERGLGYAAATNSIWELEQANCILVFNSNVTENQNVVGVPIKRAVRNGTRLIVIDPREVELTRYAHSWLRPKPGTELLLLGGILKSLLDQGLERQEWIATHCEDPATLHYALHSLDLAEIIRETGVSAEQIAQAATWFGEADGGSIVYGLDNVSEESQRDCIHALVDLALLTGNVGQPGAGLYPMLPGANEQGAWDMGCVPNRLPGARAWRDEEAQQAVEQSWNCTLPTTRGLGVAGAVTAARDGQVKAMLVVGDSANFDNGKLRDALAALQNLEFLVVHHAFLSPLAQRADVVLPRTHFTEKDGTYTNLARRIQRVKPALTLPEDNQSRPESWVIGELARRLQASGFDHPSSAAVMAEIAQVCPIYGGVSHQRLEDEAVLVFRSGLESPKPTQLLYTSKEYPGIQWPCGSADAPGTPILYQDGFPRGNANPITPEFRLAPVESDPEYPAQYVPGRVLLQRDRTMQIVAGKLNRISRDELVQLNPVDASSWAISEGDTVEVQTPRGRLVGLAALDETVPLGAVAVTTLFGQLAVDLQASEEIDPMSRVPGLDIIPARVIKIAAEALA
ncbi:MAG: molybdopterin oxidoreductase family protein, partial [Dehalococcoidia bacterium]